MVAFDHDIIDTLLSARPFDAQQRPWYIAARDAGHTVWVDTYIDANTKKLVTTCATPLYDSRDARLSAWLASICCSIRSSRICSSSTWARPATPF